MEDCKLCGESVPDDDVIEVAGYGMETKAGVFHAVCWDNYEDQLDSRPVGSRPEPRWQLKPKPGVP
jgi:hypothetical protein